MKRTSTIVTTYALAWFLLNGFRATVPVLLPELRRLYEVGFTDAGLVFAFLFAGLALVQFPSGVVADVVGDRSVVLASLVASSVVLSLFAFAATVPAMLVLGFSFGVAVGSFRSVAISAVTKTVSDARRSRALGLMATGNPLGNLLGPILAAGGILWLGVVGLPIAFGAVGLATTAGLGFVLFRDDPVGAGPRNPSITVRGTVLERVERLSAVLTSRLGALVVFASLAYSVTWQGMFTFLPTYLVEVRQLALGGSGVVTGITFGVGIVANVSSGRLADSFGDSLTLFAGFLLGAVSLVGLFSAGGFPLAFASLVGLGLGLGAITPPRDAFVSRLSGPADRGSIVGGVRTTYILLASGGTAITGLVIDSVGFDGAFLLFAAILAAGSLTALALFLTVEADAGRVV